MPPPSPPPPPPEEKHSDDDSFQEFLNELDEKHKGQPPPEEVQAALLHSFETARQEPNDSMAVYNIEDADLKDGEDANLEDGEDADLEDSEHADLENYEDIDLEDGRRRHATLWSKRRRKVPPTMLALLHRQMVRGSMERRHAKTKRVAHREREDGTKMAHDVDVGPSGASNDDNDDGEAAA
jgi:hypothetical protein